MRPNELNVECSTIKNDIKIIAIKSGYAHVIMMDCDNRIYSCGHYAYGQIGIGWCEMWPILIRISPVNWTTKLLACWSWLNKLNKKIWIDASQLVDGGNQ